MNAQSGSTSSWDYLDFDLEVREGDPQDYSVVVRSPAGEAQERMSFPFDERALRDRLRDLEIALLRSGGTRRSLSREELTVQDFGRSLFEALLVGDVRTRYLMSLDKAEQQDKGLRMKLRVQPPELAVLPWEFLYDPDRDYLCFSPDTPIVRYVDLRQPVRRLSVEPPLRILGLVASPRGLDPLDVEHEKGLMNEAIEELRDDGLVELTWLEGQTWRDLRRAMRRGGPWHVFHFVGHGDFDVARQEGAIALTDGETGREHLLRSRDLARLLDGHRYLRLVFLNSCEGARGSEGDPFSGTAATLVHNRIPAVVAMQYQITDKAAIEFSRSFYEALSDGWPVDAAVTDARVAVSMDSMLEWGTPVLYMRSPDGRLFDISPPAPGAHPTLETGERQEEDPLSRYRGAIEAAWADEKLEANEVQRLKDLANNELGLNPSTAADIEREVVGDTIEATLERQEQAARGEERRKRLDEHYDRARRSHQDQEWQGVVDVFARIHAEDPAYPDPEGLLASAREVLDRMRKVAELYDQALQYADGNKWQEALECFEEVQRLEPGYRDTEELLSRVYLELTPPARVEVPDLSGQDVSQAGNALTSNGLTLGTQREVPGTVSEGQIIWQSPGAGRFVRPGTPVSITISSGPSTIEIPDIIGKSRLEALAALRAAGLDLGKVSMASSNHVPRGKIIEQRPAAGKSTLQRRLVHVTISSAQQIPAAALSSKRSTEVGQAASLSLGDQAFLDGLITVCARYTGSGYYVNEAIPAQNLADARSSIPIPTGERVIALVDNSSMLSRGIGLAICADGIRWRNYAENSVSKKLQGFLEWPDFVYIPLKEHQWSAEYGIEMGQNNVFIAWKNNTLDQHRLVELLLDIQSLVAFFIDR